jgi:hypothetical protein
MLPGADHPWLDVLTALFCRGAFEGDDPAPHRARLGWTLASGRWAMDLGPGPSGRPALAGWIGWVRTDDAGLAVLRTVDLDDMVRERVLIETNRGPHCYVMDAVVAPWADPGCYRRLIRMVRAANPDARTLAGHLCKRDGRRCWHQRPISKAEAQRAAA